MRQTGRVLGLSLSTRVLAASCLLMGALILLGAFLGVVTGSWLPLIAGALACFGVLVLLIARSTSNDSRAMNERLAANEALLTDINRRLTETTLTYRPGEPLDMLRRDLQRDLSATIALAASVDPTGPMPAPGGWAATPETLLAIVSEVLYAPRVGTVVECGSGTSTAWLGRALLQRGEGRLASLEHDAVFAGELRHRLETLGVADRADVRTAEISPVEIAGEQWRWYDSQAWSDLEDITLLFVDGPLGASAPLARYPALPLLLDRLAPGALVVLDDIDRDEERLILERWRELPQGNRLAVERWTDRAVLLRWSVN